VTQAIAVRNLQHTGCADFAANVRATVHAAHQFLLMAVCDFADNFDNAISWSLNA
jgi:hypothetical protein